ncbi:MAG: PAS domain-containing protein [bacterium]|nr:PAS domain-containing protein [bacterium]
MRYAIKLGLKIFILGVIVLFAALCVVYYSNYNNTLHDEFRHTTSVVDAVSMSMEQLLSEKIKLAQTLAITPILKEALEASNRSYSTLSERRKNEKIHQQNERWKTSKNEHDAFILEFTENSAARFLKEQQNTLAGEYGEIFLTNKYGALVASTGRLTTFAHGHKYWWQGAYNNGAGSVFFDDRGYDDSVGGYVLGVVLPIKQGDEIVGIVKVNLNILGAISTLIVSSYQEHFGDFKLVRSGGEIIFDDGSEPLKNRIPDVLSEKLQRGDTQPFVFEDSENTWLIGISEIGITSGMNDVGFGGTFESVDHKKGNIGESWYVINYRTMTHVLTPLKNVTFITFIIGVLLTILLAFAALFLGNQTAKPLMQFIEHSQKIAKGTFGSRISISRHDEIGYLGNAFNNMAEELEKTTTSMVNIESEIAERKRAEEALRESEMVLADILESTLSGYWDWDLINNTEYLSPTFKKMFGYEDHELPNSPDTWQKLIFEEDLPDVLKIFERHVKSHGRELFHSEVRYRHRDGATIWVICAGRVIEWLDDGTPVRMVGCHVDITEQKQAEEKRAVAEASLRKLHGELEQRVKERTKELEIANAELSQYAYVVSHDLKAPLRAIHNYSDFLREDLEGVLDGDQKEYLDGLNRAVGQGEGLINDLLALARVDKSDDASEVIDIKAFIHELAGSANLPDNVELLVSDNLPSMKVDKILLAQVFRNLIENAIKFNHLQVKRIRIDRNDAGEGNVELVVRDNGIGIETRFFDKIFLVFQRLHTRTEYEGTGIGLAIVKKAIIKMGGCIRVESEPGKGSAFYINIPYQEKE